MRQEPADLAVRLRAALPAALLLLASCYSLHEGRDAYGYDFSAEDAVLAEMGR